MPAYGNNLSPAETTALVAFLKSLYPPNQKPARDAALVSVVPEKP
jgi:ubiquinol-cytochrome c reductase cytochrome b subunit